MKKWYMSFLVFAASFSVLSVVGTFTVLLFFGPHTGNTSLFMALVVALAVLVAPLILAANTYKRYR